MVKYLFETTIVVNIMYLMGSSYNNKGFTSIKGKIRKNNKYIDRLFLFF